MDKFKERFLQSVDSHAIVLRLEIEKVISGQLSHSIKNQYVDDGNQELFLYLRRQADPGSIRKLCDVMVREEGYAMMNKLGRDIRRELDLLTGMHVHVVMYLNMCILVLGDTIDTINSIDIQRVLIYRGRLLAVSPIIMYYYSARCEVWKYFRFESKYGSSSTTAR